jgi:hypothetical protein
MGTEMHTYQCLNIGFFRKKSLIWNKSIPQMELDSRGRAVDVKRGRAVSVKKLITW